MILKEGYLSRPEGVKGKLLEERPTDSTEVDHIGRGGA